jgi:hypothetical protein
MINWNQIRADGLVAALDEIVKAFHAQLGWWSYIPPFGSIAIMRREKLLRIVQYLVDQIRELRED